MTVSLPYLWPRLTTCLTIRNVKTKADILVEPRRLDSTGTLNDIRERNGHYGVSSVGRGALETRGVTIFGIQHDRIGRSSSTPGRAARRPGHLRGRIQKNSQPSPAARSHRARF